MGRLRVGIVSLSWLSCSKKAEFSNFLGLESYRIIFCDDTSLFHFLNYLKFI